MSAITKFWRMYGAVVETIAANRYEDVPCDIRLIAEQQVLSVLSDVCDQRLI